MNENALSRWFIARSKAFMNLHKVFQLTSTCLLDQGNNITPVDFNYIIWWKHQELSSKLINEVMHKSLLTGSSNTSEWRRLDLYFRSGFSTKSHRLRHLSRLPPFPAAQQVMLMLIPKKLNVPCEKQAISFKPDNSILIIWLDFLKSRPHNTSTT